MPIAIIMHAPSMLADEERATVTSYESWHAAAATGTAAAAARMLREGGSTLCPPPGPVRRLQLRVAHGAVLAIG